MLQKVWKHGHSNDTGDQAAFGENDNESVQIYQSHKYKTQTKAV